MSKKRPPPLPSESPNLVQIQKNVNLERLKPKDGKRKKVSEINPNFSYEEPSSTTNPTIITQESLHKRKERKYTSVVYYFFATPETRDNREFICLFICEHGDHTTVRSNTTTHLLEHLKKYHWKAVKKAMDQYDEGYEITALAESIIEETNKKHLNSTQSLGRFLRKIETDKKKVRMCRNLNWTIVTIMNCWSYNSTGGELVLKHMLEYHKTHYPTRYQIGDELLKGLFLLVSMKVREITKLIKYCSITSDGWSGPTLAYFIGITCHFVSNEWMLESLCLGSVPAEGSKTADYISYIIPKRYGVFIDDETLIVSLVTDRGSNYLKGGKLILDVEDNTTCLDHGIQGVVQRALQKTPHSDEILSSCREITKVVKSTPEWRTLVGKNGFLLDSPTRWNGMYLLGRDFIDDWDKFEKVRKQLEDLKYVWPDLSKLKSIIHILEILYICTKDLSASKYVTVSLVPSYVYKMIAHLQPNDDEDSSYAKQLRKNLLEEVEKQFGWILTDTTTKNIYLLSCCVDPRFGSMDFIKEPKIKDEIWKTFTDDLIDMDLFGTQEQILSRKENSIMKSAQEAALQSQILLLRTTFETQNKYKTLDPLTFWRKDTSFSLLHDVVRFHLCSMASSAPSERLFKSSSNIYSPDRAQMDPINVEYATFIRENHHLIRKYSVEELLDQLLTMDPNLIMNLDFTEKDVTDVISSNDEDDIAEDH